MGIRSAENTGTEEILRDARFHVGALLADPRTSALADSVRRDVTTLKAKRSFAEEKEEVRVEALARLSRCDFELDDRLRQVELLLFADVRKNREDPRYRGVFQKGKGLSEIVALRGEDEAREVTALVSRLREREPALGEVHGPELERLAAAAVETEAAWRRAETAAASAFGDEVLARTELVRQLQKNEGALLVLFPGQRRRVRSFFRPTRQRGAPADDGAPEPPSTPARP